MNGTAPIGPIPASGAIRALGLEVEHYEGDKGSPRNIQLPRISGAMGSFLSEYPEIVQKCPQKEGEWLEKV